MGYRFDEYRWRVTTDAGVDPDVLDGALDYLDDRATDVAFEGDDDHGYIIQAEYEYGAHPAERNGHPRGPQLALEWFERRDIGARSTRLYTCAKCGDDIRAGIFNYTCPKHPDYTDEDPLHEDCAKDLAAELNTAVPAGGDD